MGRTYINDRSKKRALLFAEFFDVVSVSLTNEDKEELDVIFLPDHIEQLETMLAKRQVVKLRRPIQDVPPSNLVNVWHSVHSIGEPGAISNYLSKRKYLELDKDMTASLNQDWEVKPKQRFIAARALVGCVIIETEKKCGLLVLSLEVCGRDQNTDSHAEQRSTVGSNH